MPLQILSERILNNATLLSVLSGIVDFIKLLILNSHLINAIEIVMVKYFWRDFKPLFLTHYIFDVASYNLLLNVCVCNCRTGYIAQPH